MTTIIEGKIQTGLGRGSKFMSLPVYSNIFHKYFSNPPFCGTLNLMVDLNKSVIIDGAFESGDIYEELYNDGKRVGDIIVIRIILHKNGTSLNCVAVRPLKTSHSEGIIEIVSDKYIRGQWDVTDDDKLNIEINFDQLSY
jgi:CTP-dependent riboflavin kinase